MTGRPEYGTGPPKEPGPTTSTADQGTDAVSQPTVRSHGHTAVPKATVQDSRVSYAARGALLAMLAGSDEDIPPGLITELERAGYVRREGGVLHVYDRPGDGA